MVGTPSPLAPNEQFNALSQDQKKKVLSAGLGSNILTSGLEFVVPLWWVFEDPENNLSLRNGSAFLVDLGLDIFAVTAAHVFRAYGDAKQTAARFGGCQLGGLLFAPETRLISCQDDLDIATFRINADEARQIGKAIVTAGPSNWEPLSPAVGNFAFFAGFPAQARGMTPNNNFVAAPYFAMSPITSITDHQIACRFDREKSIDFSGSGLPPIGYDIGGVSGGPMLMPTLIHQDDVDGVVWRFAGVVVQAAAGDCSSKSWRFERTILGEMAG